MIVPCITLRYNLFRVKPYETSSKGRWKILAQELRLHQDQIVIGDFVFDLGINVCIELLCQKNE